MIDIVGLTVGVDESVLVRIVRIIVRLQCRDTVFRSTFRKVREAVVSLKNCE